MKYMAVMPGKRKPKAVPKRDADWYRQNARKFWEYPDTLSAAKAREAIQYGMEAEAGVRLTWESGHPVAQGDELQGEDFVPQPDIEQLEWAWESGNSPLFWNRVKQLRPHASWEALLRVVNRITGSHYALEQLRALVRGETPGGTPVHEQRMVGPIEATQLFRSPHIVFGTAAPHQWIGEPHYRSVGFADDPFVVVCLYAKAKDITSLILQARQKALAWADVAGYGLAFTPVLRHGRVSMFTDQEGRRRRGKKYEILFPIISGLKWPRPQNQYC